jgi:hypothetical protein
VKEILEHAIRNDCTDNDCELHHLDIAQAEEVIDEANIAYYIAGVHAGIELMQKGIDFGTESAFDEFWEEQKLPYITVVEEPQP